MSEHHHCNCHDGQHCHHEYNSEEESKYQYVLNEYDEALSEEETERIVRKIADEKAGKNNRKEVLETIYSCLDLTSLKCTDNAESILKLTEKVNSLDEEHPDLKNVAAICVYPNFANIVSNSLEVEGVVGDEVNTLAVIFAVLEVALIKNTALPCQPTLAVRNAAGRLALVYTVSVIKSLHNNLTP